MIASKTFLGALLVGALSVAGVVADPSSRSDEIAAAMRAHALSAHAHSFGKRLARVPRSSMRARSQASDQASLDCWQSAFDAMNTKWQQAVAGGDVTDFDSFASKNGGLPDPNNCSSGAAAKPQQTQQPAAKQQSAQKAAPAKPKAQVQQKSQPKQQQKSGGNDNNSNSNGNNSNSNSNSNDNNGSTNGVCGSVNAKPIDALLSQASSQLQAIGGTIKAAAAAENIPPQLLVAIAYAESTGGQDGAAYANGGGMFQFTDAGAWAQYGGGASRMDNGASAWAAARYMHDLCSQNGGLWNALRAYNGPLDQGGNPDYQNEIYQFMNGQNFS